MATSQETDEAGAVAKVMLEAIEHLDVRHAIRITAAQLVVASVVADMVADTDDDTERAARARLAVVGVVPTTVSLLRGMLRSRGIA